YEDNVIGQSRLGNLREIPQIGKEYNNLLLATAGTGRPTMAPIDLRGREQRRDANRTTRAQLAGQANIRRRTNAAQDLLFLRGRSRPRAPCRRPTDPTVRASA